MSIELIGLALNMAGTGLVFFYGFPQPDFEETVGLALQDNTPMGDGMTVKQHGDAVRAKKKVHKQRSYLALSLVFVGFLLQFCGLLTGK